MIGSGKWSRYVGKAKRTEAHLNLGAIHTAQKAYWAEHGRYTDKLTGPDGIGWEPEGQLNYTYGFSGKPGLNYFEGKLKGSSSDLATHSKSGKDFFVVAAVADIDGDGEPDVITINDKREIKIVRDDLS